MLVRYGFDYQSTLGNTVLVEALSPNGTALFSKIDTLAPTGVYVSKEYIISLDALSNVEFRITPQNSNLTYIDNQKLNLFNGGANLFTNGDFNGNITGWSQNKSAASAGISYQTQFYAGNGFRNIANGGDGMMEVRVYSDSYNEYVCAYQSLSLINGNAYDFNIESWSSSYNGGLDHGHYSFIIATNAALTTGIQYQFALNNKPTSANPYFIVDKCSFIFTGATGIYFCGVINEIERNRAFIHQGVAGSGGGAAFGSPNDLRTFIKSISLKTGSFSTANLFVNGNFTTNGNGWDYNNAVWAWDGGAMKFEII